MKLGIYARISRLKEGNDISIDDQKDKGVKLANEMGLDYEFYIDEGLSGASDEIKDRPDFERFLGDVASKKITHVYAFDQSRFERNPQMRFIILDIFKNSGVRYFTQLDGEIDLNDSQQEFVGDLMSVINKYHVTMTKIKVKSSLAFKASQGKVIGKLPYGFKRGVNDLIEIHEEESKIIEKIFKLRENGVSETQIANQLNDEGILTRYNKLNANDNRKYKIVNVVTGNVSGKTYDEIRWSESTVRAILKNDIYFGERYYSKKVYPVPAILSKDYVLMVRNLGKLRTKSLARGQRVEYRYLLKNKLVCDICGKPYNGKTRPAKNEYVYMCASKQRSAGESCGNRSIRIPKLENLIWGSLFQNGLLSKHIDAYVNVHSDKMNDLRESVELKLIEKKKLQSKVSEAIEMALDGLVEKNDLPLITNKYKTKIGVLEKELEILQKDLFDLEHSDELVGKYKDDFDKISRLTTFSDKRKVIDDIIKYIQVSSFKNNDGKWCYIIKINFNIVMPEAYVNIESNQFDYFSTIGRLNRGIMDFTSKFNKDGEFKEEDLIPFPISEKMRLILDLQALKDDVKNGILAFSDEAWFDQYTKIIALNYPDKSEEEISQLVALFTETGQVQDRFRRIKNAKKKEGDLSIEDADNIEFKDETLVDRFVRLIKQVSPNKSEDEIREMVLNFDLEGDILKKKINDESIDRINGGGAEENINNPRMGKNALW